MFCITQAIMSDGEHSEGTSASDDNRTYQTCIWYGIHYPYELTEAVVAALEQGEDNHKALARDRECKIAEKTATNTYYRNSNSDFDPSYGCLFPSHMALSGDEFESPRYCTLDFTIAELNDLEDANDESMDALDELWRLLRKHMTPAQIADMHIGWSVYICEHEADDCDTCD
jgi:hypothetical protein